ncbi:MAG: KGG domain-containing protein [Armatimonadota bacterium]
MGEKTHGPKRGSAGAKAIADAHRGSHKHDINAGFAANPELAKEAGSKGGETVKKKYGIQHYREIGKLGGAKVKQERGSGFFREIGRLGKKTRWHKDETI